MEFGVWCIRATAIESRAFDGVDFVGVVGCFRAEEPL